MQQWSVTAATAGILAVLLSSLPATPQAAAESADAVVYAPSQGEKDNQCSPHGENCMETGCCQNENETCFAKDENFSTCLFECEPGIHEGDGEGFQTPWSCVTPDLWKCSKENDNCAQTACCQNPDLKCYKKNANFSSCKASCEPGIHGDDDPKFQTPWNCSEVTQACGEVYQQCGGKGWAGATCCNSGCSCVVTSVYYHQCARTDVGIGENDGSANTCSGAPAPPPQTEDEASGGHGAKKPSHASEEDEEEDDEITKAAAREAAVVQEDVLPPGEIPEKEVSVVRQRQTADRLQKLFEDQILEDMADKKYDWFGITPVAEVVNGRSAMMGIVLGVFTEWATDVSVTKQIDELIAIFSTPS
mmetsp:Transcript_5504/g.14506  ORF Transcript_5504/g.14506 Transcript_5504/m.14506 type:complete len:361 (-) Transcript_5504:113-1195(-)